MKSGVLLVGSKPELPVDWSAMSRHRVNDFNVRVGTLSAEEATAYGWKLPVAKVKAKGFRYWKPMLCFSKAAIAVIRVYEHEMSDEEFTKFKEYMTR